MKNIKIRKAKTSDAGELAAAFKIAYLPLFQSQKLSAEVIEKQFSLNEAPHLLKRIKGNYFFVAEDVENAKLIGLIGLRKDDNSPVHNRISTFFVLEEYRGKGIGSNLYKKILDIVRKTDVKKLVVSSSFFAEEIYKHWGFKRVNIRTEKYPNGDVYKNIWMENTLE